MSTLSHLLVLDADLARRDELVRLLKNAGHHAVVAATPTEATRALAVPGLDLVVVGLQTPGLDGTRLRESIAPSEPVEPEPLDQVERRHIARTLAFTRGNKRRAAHLLGIARSTLLAKVRRYGLEGPGSGSE
jgi:DNA-binding NtrC family response regulator